MLKPFGSRTSQGLKEVRNVMKRGIGSRGSSDSWVRGGHGRIVWPADVVLSPECGMTRSRPSDVFENKYSCPITEKPDHLLKRPMNM